MNPSNNDYVIKIKDVLFVALKKIWLVILVGVIVGGALFSYNVMQVVKTNDILDVTKRINAGESEAQYQIRVQKIERARVLAEMIDNANDKIDYQRAYIADSIYMQIDPDNTYYSTAQITLSLENYDTSGLVKALLSAYEREIKYGDFLNEYAENTGTKPEYVRELIIFSTDESSDTLISFDNDVNRTGSMFITVYGPSREFVDEVMDLVMDEIDSINVDISSSVAPHSISVVGIQQFVRAENGVRERQIDQTSKIQTYQDQIATYNKTINEIAKDLGLSDKSVLLSYFKSHAYVEVNGVPSETSERYISRKTMIKPNLKWFGIGFGIGAVVVVCLVFIVYIFGRKILTQAQFFGLYRGIKRIGVMKPLGKRSKISAFIDVKSEDDTKQSAENCNQLINANYSNLTKDLHNVLITGTGDAAVITEAVKQLNITGDVKPDIFNNPSVLKNVTEYDGIVLIEQRRKSLKPVIENEIELLTNSGVDIIGAIII